MQFLPLLGLCHLTRFITHLKVIRPTGEERLGNSSQKSVTSISNKVCIHVLVFIYKRHFRLVYTPEAALNFWSVKVRICGNRVTNNIVCLTLNTLSEWITKAYIYSPAYKAFNTQIYLPKCLHIIPFHITVLFNEIYYWVIWRNRRP